MCLPNPGHSHCTGVGFTAELYKKWNTSHFYNASAGNSDLISQNIFWSAGVKF